MRILHTMLRVGDLQRSIDFYTRVLGMTLLRKSENSEYKYTLAFVGYGDEKDEAVIELTYNWGVSEYELGSGLRPHRPGSGRHLCHLRRPARRRRQITREPGPVKGGTTVIAFVEDPDGYKIELIAKKDTGTGLGV